MIAFALFVAGSLVSGALAKLSAPAGGSDATDSIDNSLAPNRRVEMQAAREHLLLNLDSAQSRLPGDLWIIGQRLRFLVDAHRNSEAVRLARSCRMEKWWCGSLAGYALERQKSFAESDSAFGIATAALPLSVRCNWTDIRVLLTATAAREYASKSCAVRDSLATNYWWLATPLLSEGISRRQNVRRATHFSRKVLVMLHSSLEADEHFLWKNEQFTGRRTVLAAFVFPGSRCIQR